MVAIPLAMKSDPGKSLMAGNERLVNCYAEATPEGSDVKFGIYRSPGMIDFYPDPSSLSRGMFALINVGGVDSLLSLHGTSLQQIDSVGVATVLGNVFGSEEVTFARNLKSPTPQVGISDPEEGVFVWDGSTVVQITDPDLLGVPNSVDFLNGYMLMGFDDGRFQGTDLNEMTSVDALNFGTADGHPDGMRRLFVHEQQVYLMGNKSIEIWVYEPDEEFPFIRLKGAVIPVGLLNRNAVTDVSGKMFWVDDTGIVRRRNPGYVPLRISHNGVEDDLQQAIADGEAVKCWGYLDGGHEFLVVTCTSWTWVWDNVLEMWHERVSNRFDSWQAQHYAYIFGKHLVASKIQGGIYSLNKASFDEAGSDLVLELITPNVRDFPGGASVHWLDILLETGVGLFSGAAEDMDPELMVSCSKDGGKTFSIERRVKIGTAGQYRKTVRVTRWGAVGRQGIMFKIRCSAAVFAAILKLDAEAGPRRG
jgi:hypothetical protein